MIDYHKVTKNISINLLIFNKLRHSIALFFTQFKTASEFTLSLSKGCGRVYK